MKELLEPLKAESLSEIFVSRFEELILSGKLRIGQKLPSERELALQLGVSRPVVHEGLMELSFKGLVSIQPRVGTVINDFRKEGSLALLNSLFLYPTGQFEPELLSSLLQMRELLEVENARLAARNRTDEHLVEFQKIISEETEVPSGDTARVVELDFRFHHQTALATGNLVYPLVINSFKTTYTNLTMQFFSDPSVTRLVFDFHKQITGAISAQDEQRAVKIMQQLLVHGEQALT